MNENAAPRAFDALDPYAMVAKAEAAMREKALKPHGKAFLLAIMAGIFIGLGFVYCAFANATGAGKIVGGLVFSLGLMLVIILGADLFTSTTMTLIPKASQKITWRQMFTNWAVVYAGNFVGSLLLVGLILMSGHLYDNDGAVGLTYLKFTEHKLSYTFMQAVGLGILCNLMVCLGVWMSYSGRSVADKMLCCLFPVGLFIACGFEHSVANMFMIPAGIFCLQFAPESLLDQLNNVQHYREMLTWSHFFLDNLLPVTIGNIIGGGVLVGLFQWLVYLRPDTHRHHPRLNNEVQCKP